MKVVHTFAQLATHATDISVAIGVFDGVHRGHQAVITRARDNARSRHGQAVVLTFDPHPMRVLHPGRAPLLLTSTEHKLRLIRQLDVDICLLVKFDAAFAAMTATHFVELLCHSGPHVSEICVGTRFHFGHNRQGNADLLRALASRYGYLATEIAPVRLGDESISSSTLRRLVKDGDLTRAAAMLGRPYTVCGDVTTGDQRGRQLGFPTANISPHNELLPPDGVYAVRAIVAGQDYGGVANIGVRPTFSDPATQHLLEAHLFDFNRDIYGGQVELAFVARLRGEQKFASTQALRQQIIVDVERARQILKLQS